MFFAYLFALLIGFVSAGFIASLWPLIGGRDVSVQMLRTTTMLLPFEILAVVLAMPLLLVKTGAQLVSGGTYRGWGIFAFGGSIISSFFQGVALLSIAYKLM